MVKLDPKRSSLFLVKLDLYKRSTFVQHAPIEGVLMFCFPTQPTAEVSFSCHLWDDTTSASMLDCIPAF